jgi:integrase
MTVIGIDAHKRTHTFVAIDSGGRKLGQRTVSANSSGYAKAMRWATTRFGIDLTWAVEDNRSVTRLRALINAGCDVVTVQRALGHQLTSVTLDTYGHLWPNANDRTRNAAGKLLEQSLRSAADALRTEGPI